MALEQTSRRGFLKTAGLAGAFSLLPGLAFADGRKGKANRKRVLRFAHITDMHVHHEGTGAKWLGRALEHCNDLEDRPSMILFGGDMIFDGHLADAATVRAQWSEFHGALRNSNSLPVQYCLGNHDVWGWGSPWISNKEALYGKRWAMDTLGIDHTYYSFDSAGWHFVVLDSISRNRNSYIGKLGADQLRWLQNDLATHTDKPTIVMSHIPLLAACTHFFGAAERDGMRWHVPGTLMHIDARATKNLFLQHPNVRLAISGHIHLVDRVDYNGVSYLCNGAVCGNWWQGAFQETPPGYAVIDLFDDGTWHREYMKYGWQANIA